MRLEIKKIGSGWHWKINSDKSSTGLENCGAFNSARDALEAGSKKLLELLPKEIFDFGDGLVPAHQHPNGGGWVANTAHVDETAFIESNAQVYDSARVCGYARILGSSRVYNEAYVYGYAQIYGNSHIYGKAFIYGNSVVSSSHICGKVKLCGETRIYEKSFLC